MRAGEGRGGEGAGGAGQGRDYEEAQLRAWGGDSGARLSICCSFLLRILICSSAQLESSVMSSVRVKCFAFIIQ